jgi:hypothetical protein
MESAMLSNDIQMSGIKFQRLSAVIGLGLLFLLCSCANSNYGKLEASQEVTNIFDNFQILSDHSYYYSGLQGVPDAIVGIHSSYSLKSKMWQQVSFSSFALRKLVDRMAYVHMVTPRGAWILGPEGNRIGVWYSSRHQTTVHVREGNHVAIAPPPAPGLKGSR